MAVRRIGLSLGADICWPAAYEDLLKWLDLQVEVGGEQIRFETERVTVEPFDLRYKPRYDLVLDRLTHWFGISREWVKKIALMDGVYVLNNPWSIQSMEKHTTYCAMMRLGFPIPDTWMIPAKEYDLLQGDTAVTIKRYNRMFELATVGRATGYPAFLKPYDGGAWVGVRRVDDDPSLIAAYDASGIRVNHLQAAVKDWDVFVRGIGIGPLVHVVRYDPSAALHQRYMVDFHFLDGPQWATATKTTRVINAFFGWDFNSCEMLRSDGVLQPIDFANPCPDSQVTSLHYHFPWLVKALLRWTLFCASVRRPPVLNLAWAPYLEIADLDLPFEDKLERYDALAHAHFDADRFAAFDATWLSNLDEVAVEYFGSQRFFDVVSEKVAAVFPADEVQRFSDHFFGLVQFWRKTEADRLSAGP